MPPSGEPLAHPYFPRDSVIPGYQENQTPVLITLGSFASVIAFLLLGCVAFAKRANPKLRLSDLLLVCWFVLSGFLHCFFEGYLILNHRVLPGSQGLFAQLWKEYALSDSRYLTADPFVLCIETITVIFWGPCCLATALCIVRGNSLRYPLQIIACLAHLYGVALYYSTSYVDMEFRAVAHSRPEFLYFWVYYVGMNLPWAVVPALILLSTTRQICQVFDAVEGLDSTLVAAADTRGSGLELKKHR